MPDPTLITEVRYTELGHMLHPEGSRRQPMPRFDDEFIDIADYIIRITYRIWEMKQIERIRDYYEPEMRIHTMAGFIDGAELVVDNTEATLRTFPDRTLWGDDVIWSSNNGEDFYSSHRIVSNMTYLGASDWGAPNGRHATVMTIADCAVRANRVYEEWLVRDNLSLVLQLGLDPALLARQQAGARTAEMQQYIEQQRYETKLAQGGMVQNAPIAKALAALWLGDAQTALAQYYAPAVSSEVPAGRRLNGQGEVLAWWQYLRAICQNPCFSADHLCQTLSESDAGTEVALRWRVSAQCSRTGQPIYILGVTHWHLVAGKVVREWLVFDELALMSQICEQ